MPATNSTQGSPAPRPTARWAAGAKRWAASVAVTVATYAVGVACLVLSVYEAETALAALLRVARAGVVVWHGAQRGDARAHTTDALASPAFIIMEEEACAPRAVAALKRRGHSAAYGARHSSAPTTAPAMPVEEEAAPRARHRSLF